MTDKEKIVAAVFAAIDEINNTLLENNPLDKALETVLLGDKGKLDSLGTVSLITSVEQQIEEGFGVSITLADERALSQQDSPFKTVRSLTDYIALLLSQG